MATFGDDPLLLDMELDSRLAKIRAQVTSKLENQKQLALVLQAIDENLADQKQKQSPVTYFVSFISLLDQCCDGEDIRDSNLAGVALYFLDIVCPYTPKQLLRSKFSEILARLAPSLSSNESEAPLLRSGIGVLESLLVSQETGAWINSDNYKISPKRGLSGLLQLSLDPRPKVRKRAQEAVHKTLSTVPAGPSLEHPASTMCGEFSLNSVIKLLERQQQEKKNKDLNTEIIHNLQLIASITKANSWPLKQIIPLCDVLLAVAKTSDQYLVSSAFDAFEGLFQSMNDEVDEDRFVQVLNVLFDLKPAVNDQHLAPSWLAVIAKALTSYSKTLDAYKCILKLPDVFNIVSDFFLSENTNVRISASQCLIAVIEDSVDKQYLLLPPKTTPEVYENVEEVIEKLSEITANLLSVKFRQAASVICELIASIFNKFGSRAGPYFTSHLQVIGDWRSNEQEGFELNQVSETVISVAISSIGPEQVLNVLPLNLTNSKATGRAWLLPILRDNVSHSKLGYYISEILPLTTFFEEKIANGNPESMNTKVFATIVDQIWSLLPHFCDLPSDLIESFTDDFASKLAGLLYEKADLRNIICHALKLLVESNVTYSLGVIDDAVLNQEFPVELAQKNVEYLSATKAFKMLSVLFNVFSQTPVAQRGYVLETIDVYLQISKPEDLENTFNKVCAILKQALDDEKETDLIKSDEPVAKSSIPKLSITMMDLIAQMAKYVPESCHNALFSIFNQTVKIPDVQLQKRSYRIITKMLETEAGEQAALGFISNILSLLLETTDSTMTAAKSARFALMLAIIKLLPADQLHFVPAVVSEVIISTKSLNEKTRESAYQTLIVMATKMLENEGAPVRNSLNDPEMPDSVASLQEFFTICSAGLAGATSNMISAAITSLSCLVYEFHTKMDIQLLTDLYQTVELFLTSRNREIIKSTLGFVKVAILSLPEEMVTQNMKGLLTNLMTASHEHKNHFKSKVKHIIERLIRKFGVELVEECIPEEDKKLVANIKKSKARAKRKKTEGTGANATDTGVMSGYEAALYSESESEDEEEDSTGKPQQYISEPRDTPLDLLDKDTLTHISSSKPKKFTKKSLQNEFKTKNGKLVVDEEDDGEILAKDSIDAYVEAVKQGPVRGQKNKLRYKHKKGDDIDWDDGSDTESKPKTSNKVQKPQRKPKNKFKSKRRF
ncbi:hypothetical protein OGAPHI_002660 [Ogataea philodendri]|uniref:Ribosomal RNA-processing protein 12-like conserved domain-containing protein n=2 Tax=Saccharomycotina TaxID=147537 RepID=A0A9P8PC72_9ASCO|nr:uncharacterized protein OGAPHI_002660 [Ogataea philodendri]KAH3668905.1 hypothetical protein OGAPHI_002660 [Ogataea philodendri]